MKANNLKIQNGQQIHVSFEKCMNVQVSNLKVTAPENSPNTDGIHVANTQNIQISSCIIGTGTSHNQKIKANFIFVSALKPHNLLDKLVLKFLKICLVTMFGNLKYFLLLSFKNGIFEGKISKKTEMNVLI